MAQGNREDSGVRVPSYDWRSCANRHLLAYVLRRAKNKTYYCHPQDTVRMGPPPDPHPLTKELTFILLKHAHCWALDMGDWPNGSPTASEQRLSWERAMEEAEKEVRSSRERAAPAINAFTELMSG